MSNCRGDTVSDINDSLDDKQQLSLLKSILESPKGIIVFSLDLNYRYTYFTKAHQQVMKQIWNVDIQNGMCMLDAIKKIADRKKAKSNFDRALAGEYIVANEEYGDEELSRMSWEDRYSPIYDESKNIIGLTVFVTDITLLVEAQKALRVSQIEKEILAERELLLNCVGEGMYCVDNDGRCIFINPAALEMLGYQKNEVLGKNTHELFHHHYPDGTLFPLDECIVHKAIASGIKIETKGYFFKKNGDFLPVRIIATPIVKERSTIGVIIAFNDITLQHELEEKLKKLAFAEASKRLTHEKMLEAIFNALNFGIFITNKDGYFERVNDTFCKITGFLEEELIGRKFDILFSDGIREHTLSRYEEQIKSDNLFEYYPAQWELKSKYGRKLHVQASFAKVLNENGDVTMLTSINDITAQIELKNKNELQESILIQQSKMAEMGEMLGAIIHQLKQPLHAINGSIQLLALDASFGELSLEMVKKSESDILKSVKFMSETMENFRNFFKPQKEKHTFNIANAIEEILNLLSKQLKVSDISIELAIVPDVFICGYENELKQVLLNIINNAREELINRSTQDPCISICMGVQQNICTINIHDNGGGIVEDLLPNKIFEPYVTTKGTHGTGIGLSLSKTIIEKHFMGKLMASNENGGAKFSITLPY